MAISKRIGQDSEGVPIYRRDAQNAITEDIDEDLSEILASYQDFKANSLTPSQYIFSVPRSKIGKDLQCNPQMFLPHLNETLEKIEALDGVEGWNVTTLDQLAPTGTIRVFKGPRLKSENLIVDQPGPGIEPYYTPSSMLQEKSDSVKYLKVGFADKKQKATIDAIRVKQGDIVITRSGSVGRVAIITSKHHNAIVSDDLIRVRIDDAQKRSFVFAFLQSKYAQDQMARNEYGAIQQHLEPQHIRNLLVPWPEDEQDISALVVQATDAIAKREALDAANQAVANQTRSLIEGLIARADQPAAAVRIAEDAVGALEPAE
jgi:preprotein translocase subunit YajC